MVSTIDLKIINGILEADNGIIKLGSKVQIGYYDQEHNVLNMDKTVFDEISDEYPTLTNTEIRNVLAAFLFTNDDVFKRIDDLSGGERGRVSLAKLMLSEANFLILDEPTNHLDIASKEILEQALASYTGTVLFVSHDRYFINKTATRILDLHNNNLVNYIGNYDYYLEKREELSAVAMSNSIGTGRATTISGTSSPSTIVSLSADTYGNTPNTSSGTSKSDWQAQKEEQARARKIKNDFQKTEEAIEKLETRNSEIDELLTKEDIYTNVEKLMELNKEKESIQSELEQLLERWEELSELIE